MKKIMTDAIIPDDFWEGDDEGVIVAWFYQTGAAVAAGDVIAEIMVEKIQYEYPSPADGILDIVVETDGIVNKGALIARIT